MKKFKYISSTLALSLLLVTSSCDLNEVPVDTATNEAVFGSESGLELYSNSFYDLLPNTDVGVFQDDDVSDIVARNGVDDYLAVGALSPITSSGWALDNWRPLRNINYFIANTEKSTVGTKNHYLGLARFFRAYFYFDKVKRFGNVPWIETPIEVTDMEKLNAPRDDRFEVMDKVLADLNFAIENITLTSDPSVTRITKNVARAYKTRICLYEASFRKYHTSYNKQATAKTWYEEVIKEANAITGFSLHQGASLDRAYREMFIARTPYTDETILSVALSASLQIYSSANRRFISPTYGNRPSLTRRFVNTYLNLDGTPFTGKAGYKTTPFVEEVKSRDLRLKQTIRVGDYTRTENGVPVIAPPNFSQTVTGYQPIKWSFDERFPYDDESRNDNAHIIMRWGEVLLNKAEALAELDLMTATEWTNTIGALRKRAGITGATLTTVPTVADPYMIEFFNGKFTDPVLLEVLRERGTEMVFEGLRRDDLIRWRLGDLFQKAAMNGIYVSKLGEHDLNGDGKNDVHFYQGTKPTSTTPGIAFVDVSPSTAAGRLQLSGGTSGEVIWNPGPREWADKKYLYPIPEADRVRNPQLGQNPGWQ
ncbi:RagB/SusD family nutrient uptake outer membrane protein [Dyadobacter sp. Leaf189]|uniref:RagB/SusD family nutrient uptake outer membrane protein n=1 Tax=Dyadobacter sp. Leaf189 TaxID=1736295 RepID=UPI0006F953D1|nr:RagB/SusD family nutrient uptake outer membrane protein [Dyadobacter sp. Leaf189]KQS30739.1 glycan metabolism protein [Dyadobacter sp. Leaf189]